MRQRNHSLQQDFNNGRRVVDSICGYMNRRVEYLCRVCLRGTQNSTKTCCESRFLIFYVHSFGMIASIREIWRSKRSQMITVVSFSAVNQITVCKIVSHSPVIVVRFSTFSRKMRMKFWKFIEKCIEYVQVVPLGQEMIYIPPNRLWMESKRNHNLTIRRLF